MKNGDMISYPFIKGFTPFTPSLGHFYKFKGEIKQELKKEGDKKKLIEIFNKYFPKDWEI